LRTRTKLFLGLTVAILVFDGLFVYLSYRESREAMQSSLDHQGREALRTFRTAKQLSMDSMLQLATLVGNQPDVQRLFRQGARAVRREGGGEGGERAAHFRQALYRELGQSWQGLQERFAFRQLHFHLPPGSTSFLRVHRPGKFGDNMDDTRHTVVAVNARRESVTGFETGRLYSGLRGVVPVHAPDPAGGGEVFVGAVEAGISFQQMLTHLRQRDGFAAAVLLAEGHVAGTMWPSAIAEHFGAGQPVAGYYLEASTSPLVRGNLEAVARAAGSEGPTTHLFRHLGPDPVALTFAPLHDFHSRAQDSGDAVGSVVLVQDARPEVARYRAALRQTALYAGGAFVILTALVFFGIRRLANELEEVVARRTAELEEAQRIGHLGNWVLEINSGRLSWSDEVFRIFGLEPQAFQPTYDDFLRFVHPEDRERVHEAVERAVDARRGNRHDHRVFTPAGEERVVRELVEVQTDAAGTPERIVGTVRDITDQRALERELEHRANHDGLTGLLNRRAFEPQLNQSVARARRSGEPLSLLMFDIDHFKTVNDTYGHQVGDEVLRTLADEVAHRLRESDILARWGGEEFIVLLPETDLAGARTVAESLRRTVAESRFPGCGALTISLGVAAYQDGEGGSELTRRADEHLYAAKRHGRNRVWPLDSDEA